MRYNFALIEDNIDIRREVSDFFSQSEHLDCVMAVDTVEKFLKYHRDFLEIKLVLLDVMLYNQSSIFGIPHILQREPEAEIIMFTVMDDSKVILQALSNGATGYVLKGLPMADLEKSLFNVLDGKGALLSPAIAKKLIQYLAPKPVQTSVDADEALSDKESIVLEMLKEGRTYQEISDRIGISINGIRYYVKSIYKKFQVCSKGELFRKTTKLFSGES
jgi:DNA-binding NarL/FixJ family response regulator